MHAPHAPAFPRSLRPPSPSPWPLRPPLRWAFCGFYAQRPIPALQHGRQGGGGRPLAAEHPTVSTMGTTTRANRKVALVVPLPSFLERDKSTSRKRNYIDLISPFPPPLAPHLAAGWSSIRSGSMPADAVQIHAAPPGAARAVPPDERSKSLGCTMRGDPTRVCDRTTSSFSRPRRATASRLVNETLQSPDGGLVSVGIIFGLRCGSSSPR